MNISRLSEAHLWQLLQRTHGAHRAARIDNDGPDRPYNTEIWEAIRVRLTRELTDRSAVGQKLAQLGFKLKREGPMVVATCSYEVKGQSFQDVIENPPLYLNRPMTVLTFKTSPRVVMDTERVYARAAHYLLES